MPRVRWWIVAGQVALLVALGIAIARTVRAHWTELRSAPFDLTVRPLWLLASLAVVLATFAVLVAAWRQLIVGWKQPLAWSTAWYTWTLSNLGRYLPGKVWSIAGLAVLARRSGVSPWAATGAALVAQIVSLGTGGAVVIVFAPRTLSVGWIAGGLLMTVATVSVLAWPRALHLVAGLSPRLAGLGERPLNIPAVVLAVLATTGAWMFYGIALWLLASALMPSVGLAMPVAVGAFAASYLLGLVAIVAPGGVGVREGAMFAFLTPSLGASHAAALAVASRLILTAAEVVAAASGWLISRSNREGRA